MTDIPAATSRAGAAQSDDQHTKKPGPVLPDGRLDVMAHQRELVRASLIARPPAGDTRHDRWP